MRFVRVTQAVRTFLLLALTATALAAVAPAQASLTLTPVASLTGPMYVTAPAGDASRLFIVQRSGKITVTVNGIAQSTPFLDISGLVQTAGEGGLLSMAFAPDYATSGHFYVYYVEKPDTVGVNGDIRIEQYTRSTQNANVADPSSQVLLLEIQHDTNSNHYGGQLQWFGNRLYAGTGDGGGANDAPGNAQND